MGQEITEHYREATHRYKQKLSATMMQITDAAYWGLYDPEKVDRAMELFRMAIQMWPEPELLPLLSSWKAPAATVSPSMEIDQPS